MKFAFLFLSLFSLDSFAAMNLAPKTVRHCFTEGRELLITKKISKPRFVYMLSLTEVDGELFTLISDNVMISEDRTQLVGKTTQSMPGIEEGLEIHVNVEELLIKDPNTGKEVLNLRRLKCEETSYDNPF